MKRFTFALLSALVLVTAFAGCSANRVSINTSMDTEIVRHDYTRDR